MPGRLEALARTEAEIRGEKAAALRQTAGTFEALLARLARLRADLAAPAGRSRARRLRLYRELRERTLHQRWCLEVQREAVGLRRHDVLDEMYPMPPPLPEDR